MSNIATLSEIEKYWTINELADANEALDLKEEFEEKYRRKIKQESKR